MAINFPDSPSNGDQYVVAGNTYTWNGVSWDAGSAGYSGGGGSLDPIGTIVAWSGTSSNIPSDYQLCDGGLAQTTELEAITGANVPDLRDKFIVGASDSTGDTSYPGLSPGATGGSADATLVSHSHTINSHTHSFSGSGSDTVSISVSGTTSNQSQNHTHVFGANTFGGQSGSSAQLMDNPQPNGGGTKQGTTSGVSQDHTHSFSASGSGTASISISGTTSSQSDSGTDTQGSSATNANLPPYYSLCYIVKHTVATINSGSSTFTGLIDTPSSLGAAGQVAAVNSGGTALEFIDVPSSATTSEWSITSNGSSDPLLLAYRFTGPGFDGTENDPTIYLIRGQQYKFTNNSGGSHPFQIRTAINGTAYNDGITNNGLSSGTLTWDIQMDAPNILYYQCTSHPGMVGKIYIGNTLSDGDYVSATDFGAVGDGEVDDTNAIQDAINSGAKHLTFLPGTYKLAGTISVDDELHVFAKGAKFVQTTNSTMFNFNVTSSATAPAKAYSLSSSYIMGIPTAVTIAAGGTGYGPTGSGVESVTNAATSGGNGSNLTVDFTSTDGIIDSVTINTAGNGYEVGDTITITGGGGNATIRIFSTIKSDTLTLSTNTDPLQPNYFASSMLKAGDAIKITSKVVDRCQRDNGSSSSLYRVGEWAIVKSVTTTTPTAPSTATTTTITLTIPLKEVKGVSPTSAAGEESIVNSYDVTKDSNGNIIDAPRVIVLPRTSMSWIGGELAFEEGYDSTPWNKPVFKCSGYTNPKFSEIVITRGYQHGISLTGTVHAIIKDCSISNLTNNTSQSQYGYGVATAGTFKTLVDGCTFANTRHGFTTSSRSYQWDSNTTTSQYLGGGRDQSGMVVNCYGDGNNDNSVFDTHMCAQDYVFNNCVVDGAESGFAIRGRNVTVSNCKTFNVNRGILAHTEYANSASNSDAWANDKNHMTSVRINDCEFNAYNYSMHMKALTSCDITDVVANAGQAIVLFVEGCKVNLHGTNTFAVSNFHGTKDANSVNDKGMITVTGSTSLASYIDPGIFVSPGSYLRLDGTLATSSSNDLSIFHFNSGYSHSIVNDGKISIKLSTAIKYIRNAVDNCTFSGQGELMWESTNKHSSFATNFIGTSTDTTKWAYIDAYEIGDAIRHYWKDKRPKTVFSNIPEKLTHTGTGSKVENAIVLPSQHMRWANQLAGGEVVKNRFNIDQPDNNTSDFEISFCNGYVHNWTSSAGRQEVEITALMPAYRTQTIYIRIIEGDQAAGDTNVYAIVKDKTIAGGFNSSAQEAGAISLDITAPNGTVITVAPIETTVSRLSINVP